MTKNEQYIIDNKICFVTNSRCTYGTAFLASLQTYVNLIPFQNFWLIPGYNPEKNENTLFYGYRVFLKMLLTLTKNNYYDYVIYIDDDCFINDFDALLKEFEKFKNSDCCLAGTQDGEVLCHRNHSKIFVNTFLSFWNIKMLKNKVNDIINYINMFIKKTNGNEYYKIFGDTTSANDKENFFGVSDDKSLTKEEDEQVTKQLIKTNILYSLVETFNKHYKFKYMFENIKSKIKNIIKIKK